MINSNFLKSFKICYYRLNNLMWWGLIVWTKLSNLKPLNSKLCFSMLSVLLLSQGHTSSNLTQRERLQKWIVFDLVFKNTLQVEVQGVIFRSDTSGGLTWAAIPEGPDWLTVSSLPLSPLHSDTSPSFSLRSTWWIPPPCFPFVLYVYEVRAAFQAFTQ